MSAANETELIAIEEFPKETPFSGAVIVRVAPSPGRQDLLAKHQQRQSGTVVSPAKPAEWASFRLDCESLLAGTNIQWTFKAASPDDSAVFKGFCGADFGISSFEIPSDKADFHDAVRQELNSRLVQLLAKPAKWRMRFFRRLN